MTSYFQHTARLIEFIFYFNLQYILLLLFNPSLFYFIFSSTIFYHHHHHHNHHYHITIIVNIIVINIRKMKQSTIYLFINLNETRVQLICLKWCFIWTNTDLHMLTQVVAERTTRPMQTKLIRQLPAFWCILPSKRQVMNYTLLRDDLFPTRTKEELTWLNCVAIILINVWDKGTLG